MRLRKLAKSTISCSALGVALCASLLQPKPGLAQLGSNRPSDADLLAQRATELERGFVVKVPKPGTALRPVQRVPRQRFGVVGPLPLDLDDLDALVYPDATRREREALLEGLRFFTTQHTAREGAGPVANQRFCQGCHLNSNETIRGAGLVEGHLSNVSRAGRSSPTNFRVTAGNATTGGRAADHLDAVRNTGRTAAFTIFGDYSPSTNVFDPLNGTTSTIVFDPTTGKFREGASISGQQFGGFVQHTRPTVEPCLPDRLPSVAEDRNLDGADPATGLSKSGFRRATAERAGPPYIGRGLMEAIPNWDLVDLADPEDAVGAPSSLHHPTFACKGDCIKGRPNIIPESGGFVGLTPGKPDTRAIGRFGLRANGVEMLQFVIGGLQGELGFTSLLNNAEPNVEESPALDNAGCRDARVPDPEVRLSTPFSERNFLRMTAPPEFGDTLLALLTSRDHERALPLHGRAGQVRRGAKLFGVDLVAFANRMIPGRMPPSGDDGRDPHAIDRTDRRLGCVGCHTPVQRTGRSPAVGLDFEVVGRHLSFVWAPIFSDLLLHAGPVIDAERFAPTPRDPLVVRRPDLNERQDRAEGSGARWFDTFDLPRNLADDAFSNQQAAAFGPDFRTAPLMGMGRIGPPFLHDARVYLSRLTRDTYPAGTVMTNSRVTNAPLVVRTLDDAIRAAIELHDLPAPDDGKTPRHLPGAGCPVPPDGRKSVGNVSYGPSPADVICPPYDSPLSRTHRSEAREVVRRYRALDPKDQQALIEFLKEL